MTAPDHPRRRTMRPGSTAYDNDPSGSPRGGTGMVEQRFAYMRYVGQGHEVMVPLPAGPFSADAGPVLYAAFERSYRALYDRLIPNLEVEVLSWSLKVATPVDRPRPIAALAETTVAAPVGSRQVVDPDRTGLLVPVRDPEALASAIVELVLNPQRRQGMGERARKKSLAEFDQDQVIEKTLTLYGALLARTGRRPSAAI